MKAITPEAFAPSLPEPLVREMPLGAPYPVHALGPLREAVEAVQGMTQAPIAIPAQSALAVASLAVQAHADVETLGRPAPLSLYALTIAQSGERKSSCDGPLIHAVREVERSAMEAWREDAKSAYITRELWKAEYDAAVGRAKKAKGADKAGARADLEALGGEPPMPAAPERIVTEPTLEGLTRLFEEGQPSLGLFSDEGGQFLGGHAMNSDNRQKTLAALNGVWGGEPIRRTRKGDGFSTLYGRRLAMHLMVQPVVADAFMADALANGTGFLPRCLIVSPPSAIGQRLYALTRRDTVPVDAFAQRIASLLARQPDMDPDTRELKPRRLTLGTDARTTLIAFSDAVENAQRTGGDLAHVTGYASKAAEQAARIAGVLTVYADPDARSVELDAMRDGIALAQFYLGEAARLADGATVSVETQRAERLRRWLTDEWPARALALDLDPATVIPADVARHGPAALRETKVAKAALGLLAAHGWVTALQPGTEVNGAPRKLAYRVYRGPLG